MTIVIGLLAGILIAEILLRVYVASRGWTANCYATGASFFVPENNGGQTLRPGLRLRSSTYNVRVNDAGFRGPDLVPAPERRVVVLGGSSVFGYLVGEGEDSCRILEGLLSKGGLQCEVINAGVPGFRMCQVQQRFEQRVAHLHPDIVLLYLGWNDLSMLIDAEKVEATAIDPPSWWNRMAIHSTLYSFIRYRLFPARQPKFAPPADKASTPLPKGIAIFDKTLDDLIHTIHSNGATVILSTQLMASNLHCEELDSFLGSTPEQVLANRQLGRTASDAIRRAADRNDLVLIDVQDHLPCGPELLGDAIHLTADGHEKVAGCWFPVVAKSFAEQRR